MGILNPGESVEMTFVTEPYEVLLASSMVIVSALFGKPVPVLLGLFWKAPVIVCEFDVTNPPAVPDPFWSLLRLINPTKGCFEPDEFAFPCEGMWT